MDTKSGGTTPGPVNCSENPQSLRKTDMHGFEFSETDMTGILRSFPAFFLEAYQWGGEARLSTFTLQAKFKVLFSKENDGSVGVCCVPTTDMRKKVNINIPKFVCHKATMKADVSLDTTIVNLTSKSQNIHLYC